MEGGRYLGNDEVVLDGAHVVVVDGVRGHEAPRVELKDCVVEGGFLHQLSSGGLKHFLADLHAGDKDGGREGGMEGGR